LTTEDQALTVRETGLAVHQSPMDALAIMSDAEFEQRLTALKIAQKRMATIQREMMEKDVDYGVIPGTGDKPTLLKPGAERLCAFHKLVPTFEETVTLGDGITSPHIRVSTKCSLHYLTDDGPIVGQGVGAANSWEKKYRYRDAQRKCPDCGAAAIYRSKYPDKKTGEMGWYCFAKKGGCGATFGENDPAITGQQQGQMENPDPFDGENTLKKMSAKRSYIDATLRATATSGLFTQDVEDMEPETPKPNGQSAPVQRQAPRPQPETPQPDPARAADKAERQKLQAKWGELWNKARDIGLATNITLNMTTASIDQMREAVERLDGDIIAFEMLKEQGKITPIKQEPLV
jgi:hypothetical protein